MSFIPFFYHVYLFNKNTYLGQAPTQSRMTKTFCHFWPFDSLQTRPADCTFTLTPFEHVRMTAVKAEKIVIHDIILSMAETTTYQY